MEQDWSETGLFEVGTLGFEKSYSYSELKHPINDKAKGSKLEGLNLGFRM